MEVVPNNHEPNLMTFSYQDHGFEYKNIREFEFDEEFNSRDPGQMQNEPAALDEQDLLSRLRDTDKRNKPTIPPTIYEFYDKCKKHFYDEFISLLTCFLSNIESTKRLREYNSEDRLLEFFNLKLSGPLNFGKHQTFVAEAAECNSEMKTRLRACGKEIQQLAQAAREKATAAARIKLQACSEDFTTFGEQEWMRQCRKTSRHNILDQHFAVRCFKLSDDTSDEDDCPNEFSSPEDDVKLCRHPSGFTKWQFMTARMQSIKKYDAAEPNSLKRQRQRQLYAEVSVRADTARPEVALGERFRLLDRRLDGLEESKSSRAQGRASTATDASQSDDDTAPPLQNLTRKVLQLERQVQTMQVSTPHDTSKNDSRADSADTQQPAGKRRRRKRVRTEDADTNAAYTTSPAAYVQHTMTTVPQHPRPLASNHASGHVRNATKKQQQHRGGHQGGQRQARGPAQTHDSTPQPQDVRRRQDNVQGQAAPNRGGQGRGRGRGQGRG